MTNERKIKIENLAKETGLSFVDAERMLIEIESDVDTDEIMREVWY